MSLFTTLARAVGSALRRAGDGLLAWSDDGAPVEESAAPALPLVADEPAADAGAGPPVHWLEAIRAKAPWLLTGDRLEARPVAIRRATGPTGPTLAPLGEPRPDPVSIPGDRDRTEWAAPPVQPARAPDPLTRIRRVAPLRAGPISVPPETPRHEPPPRRHEAARRRPTHRVSPAGSPRPWQILRPVEPEARRSLSHPARSGDSPARPLPLETPTTTAPLPASLGRNPVAEPAPAAPRPAARTVGPSQPLGVAPIALAGVTRTAPPEAPIGKPRTETGRRAIDARTPRTPVVHHPEDVASTRAPGLLDPRAPFPADDDRWPELPEPPWPWQPAPSPSRLQESSRQDRLTAEQAGSSWNGRLS